MKLDLILKASLERQKVITESPFSVNFHSEIHSEIHPMIHSEIHSNFFSCFPYKAVSPNGLFVQSFSENKIKNIFVELICIRYLICTLLINAFIASAYQETPSWLLDCRNYDAACISKRRLKVVIMLPKRYY